MKKMFVFVLIVLMLTPAAAMAQQWNDGAEVKSGAELISTLSNNVTLVAIAGVDRYAVISGHLSGSKQYASTSGDTKIYQVSSETPATITAPTNSDTAQFQSGSWSAM